MIGRRYHNQSDLGTFWDLLITFPTWIPLN
jgi:hypothetical protein